MDPSIKSLRAVVTLSRTRHFGHAAAELQVSRSTLSERIVSLERQLGGPLFVRSSRSVDITPRGRVLVERATPVLDEHDRLRAWLLAEGAEVDSRVVRVGFLTGFSTALTARVLREVRDRLPDWSVTVQRMGRLAGESMLRDGRIDVALVPGPVELESADLRGSEVWREPRVLMVESGHHLAGRDRVTLEEIRDEFVITPAGDRDDEARWWAADPRPDGTPVRYGPPARDLEGVAQMVAAGMGVTITAASSRDSGVPHGVEFVDLEDVESCGVWVLARAGEPSWGVSAVEDAARSVGRSLAPEA